MNPLLKMLVKRTVSEVVETLISDDNIETYGDRLFDFIEDAVMDSKTTIDDITILPIVRQLRKVLNIPDKPDS